MSVQTLSIDIPGPLYQRLEERARETQRTVQAEILDAIAAVRTGCPEADEIGASLAVLGDDDLWRAARSRRAPEAAERIEELHFLRQNEGLSEHEENELAGLMRRYDRAMLVRAHAAALLKKRGHDVSVLLQP